MPPNSFWGQLKIEGNIIRKYKGDPKGIGKLIAAYDMEISGSKVWCTIILMFREKISKHCMPWKSRERK